MSTRCNIIIRKENNPDNPIYVYHHCDGYPEGVGSELKDIISNHYTEAFINPSSIEQLLYKYDSQYEETDNIHGDIEYLYILTVMDDGRVKYQCIDVPLMEDYIYETLKNCELIEECFLTPDDPGEDENQEQKEIYPTFEEGLKFVINNCTYENISKEDIKNIIKTFYNYINTPLNN